MTDTKLPGTNLPGTNLPGTNLPGTNLPGTRLPGPRLPGPGFGLDRMAEFARLAALASRPDGRRITPLFAADRARTARFSVSADDLTLDFSRSSIDDVALDALFALADAAKPSM